MSKPLSNYQGSELIAVVNRRIAEGSKQGAVRGCGYWAARDYLAKMEKRAKQNSKS